MPFLAAGVLLTLTSRDDGRWTICGHSVEGDGKEGGETVDSKNVTSSGMVVPLCGSNAAAVVLLCCRAVVCCGFQGILILFSTHWRVSVVVELTMGRRRQGATRKGGE